jgi:hypothetical protein
MSLSQYARHRGCALRAVQFAIERGRIVREPDGRIDSEKADWDWDRNTNHAQARYGPKGHRMRGNLITPPTGVVEPVIPSPIAASFAQARTAKEVFEARIKKIELEERQGNLLPRRAVELQAFNRGRILRDAMLNIPARISGLLAAETDPAAVFDLLELEIRNTLEKLSEGKLG